jgi:hypothetical protein
MLKRSSIVNNKIPSRACWLKEVIYAELFELPLNPKFAGLTVAGWMDLT